MSNQFNGEGNLGQDPEIKTVKVEGTDQTVCNLRIYFDRPIPVGDGYQDKNGFWLDVEIWGKRGQNVCRLCNKGNRVSVAGRLADASYEKDGAMVNKLVLKATAVNLVLTSKVENISYHDNTEEAA